MGFHQSALCYVQVQALVHQHLALILPTFGHITSSCFPTLLHFYSLIHDIVFNSCYYVKQGFVWIVLMHFLNTGDDDGLPHRWLQSGCGPFTCMALYSPSVKQRSGVRKWMLTLCTNFLSVSPSCFWVPPHLISAVPDPQHEPMMTTLAVNLLHT